MGQKAAGFASPAQGYENETIDLNRLLIHNPASTYFFRLDSGDMELAGLPRGALLLVDRSIEPVANGLVVIQHEGQFLVRLMVKNKGYTVFSNGVTDIVPVDNETMVIGSVTACIKEYDYGFSC